MNTQNIKCFPLAGEQEYTVEDFQSYLGTRIGGVYSAEDNMLVTAASPADMTVSVSTGLAWLQAGDLRGVSCPLSEAVVLTLDPADAVQQRYDTVVVGLDKTNRTGYVKIVKGLLGGVATAPVRDGNYYELVLASVRVPASSSAILSTYITDKRLDDTVCGLMRDGVQSIPTATLQANAQALIDGLESDAATALGNFAVDSGAAISTFNGNGAQAISDFNSEGGAVISEMEQAIIDALDGVEVVNNLTTDDQYKVLSAKMGKQLQDEKAPKADPIFTGVLQSPSFVGMVAFFAGTATPMGWLKCDGSTVSRETYANLFSFIGTAFNTGGEAGTVFRLPNMSDGSFLRSTGGNALTIGIKQQDKIISHTHDGAIPITSISKYVLQDNIGAGRFTGSTVTNQTPTGDVETRPLNYSMTPCIKY